MGLFKRKPKSNPRIKELEECASVLIDKQLVQVWYHDAVGENGKPIYMYDIVPMRHEIMQGVDLVTKDGFVLGFRWDTPCIRSEYELDLVPAGLKTTLNGEIEENRFDQTKEASWSTRLNKTITKLTFSQDSDNNVRFGSICDCRIDFYDADPVWICARLALEGCLSNGDDTVVVFTEQEARRLGIRVNA